MSTRFRLVLPKYWLIGWFQSTITSKCFDYMAIMTFFWSCWPVLIRLQALFQAGFAESEERVWWLAVSLISPARAAFLAGPTFCCGFYVLFRQVPFLGETHLKITRNNYHLLHALVWDQGFWSKNRYLLLVQRMRSLSRIQPAVVTSLARLLFTSTWPFDT